MTRKVKGPLMIKGRAYVLPATAEGNPDAYLCVDTDDTLSIVLRVGSKAHIRELQDLADALNLWAGK